MFKKVLRSAFMLSMSVVFAAPAVLHGQTYKWSAYGANSSTDDLAKDITLDGSGNSYVVGSFTGQGVFDPLNTTTPFLNSSGGSDIFVAKYDKSGVAIWAAQGKGALDDAAQGVAVFSDQNMGVNTYVTGYFTGTVTFTSSAYSGSSATVTVGSGSSNNNDVDMFIAKYDNNGVILWARDVGSGTSTDFHYGWDIAVDGVGSAVEIWATGSYMGNTTFSGSPSVSLSTSSGIDAFIVNYTDGASAPAANWVERINSASTDQGLGIAADPSGNAYVVGYMLGSSTFGTSSGSTGSLTVHGGNDGWAAKYNNSGVFQWVQEFGGSVAFGSEDVARGVEVDVNGSVYVVGNFTGTGTFASYATSYASYGSVDGFVCQLSNSTGAATWVKQLGAAGKDYAKRVAVDNCGKRCYVVGDYVGTASFGNSVTLAPYNATTPNTDMFLTDYDVSNGNAIAATRSGSSDGIDNAYGVGINSVEDIQFCGAFASTFCDFDAVNGPYQLVNLSNTVPGQFDGFVARWDHSNWPNTSVSLDYSNPYLSSAYGRGIGSAGTCSVYTAGDFNGKATFGSTSGLTSVYNPLNGFYSQDAYLAILDKYGNYSSTPVILTGGTSNAYTSDLFTTSGANYIIGNAGVGAVATTFSVVGGPSFTYGSANTQIIWFGQWTTGAALTWAEFAYTTGTVGTGTSITADASGNVYITGYYSGTLSFHNSSTTLAPNGSYNLFIAKYNSSGVLQWAQRGVAGSTNSVQGLGISVDNSSSVYVTGNFLGTATFTGSPNVTLGSNIGTDIFIVRFATSTGNAVNGIVWSASGGNDWGKDIVTPNTAEVYITGQANSNTWVVASADLTSTPAWNWNKSSTGGAAGGSDIDYLNGYVYVSGNASSTTTFGPRNSTASGTCLVEYASWNGYEMCIANYGSGTTTTGIAMENYELSNDHGDNALLCGYSGVPFVTKATTEGCELSTRIGRPHESATVAPEQSLTSVYPNPFSEQATLKLASSVDLSAAPVSLVLTDMQGRVVRRMDDITSRETIISADDLVNGIYFYQVMQNGLIVSSGKMMLNK